MPSPSSHAEQRLEQAAAGFLARCPDPPSVACILGSGLADPRPQHETHRIAFDEIPHMPLPNVSGHTGAVTVLQWDAENDPAAKPVRLLVLNGRRHLYEGVPLDDVTFSVRLLARLGVRILFLVNAAGGLDPSLKPGDLMLVRDHIDLMFPPRPHGPESVPTDPDKNERLAQLALDQARRLGLTLRQGVYAAVTGPNYETRAEIRMLREMGAHAVGMSTVPEIRAARIAGMQILPLSLIANACSEAPHPPLTHDEVLAAGARGREKLHRLLRAVVHGLG